MQGFGNSCTDTSRVANVACGNGAGNGYANNFSAFGGNPEYSEGCGNGDYGAGYGDGYGQGSGTLTLAADGAGNTHGEFLIKTP